MNHNCEDTEALLSGYLDGELTQGDRQRVEVIMEDCQDCAKTFEEMKKLRNEIGGIQYEYMTEAERLKAAKDPVAETGASLGQVLVIGGFIIFYGSCIYLALKGILADPDTPLFMKIGLPAMFLGFGILLTSVIIDRIRASKTDPYKDVEI
ncbi:MAG: zf-HC2 domain-containing protein [Verrucomicrobiota bacterium]|jgi:anti-sigma factor RsiW|nr:zf-HC2 domain-containing protein [Verrucomicrobiota bacterium]